MITVYGKPGCQQCRATRRIMARLRIPFVYVDVTEQPLAAKTIHELGYSSLPVVSVENDGETQKHWSGFRPDRINQLVVTEG